MLESRRLRLLVAVADTGSIAGAAHATGCSAAAASQQLAALEQEAGVRLLERSARSVRLTSAGLVLVEHGRGILADLETAAKAVTAVGSLRSGRLRVASFSTATRWLVVPALVAFRRRHPDVVLTVEELEPEIAMPAVRAGEVDLAVTHQYARFIAPDLRGLSQDPLFTDPLVLAVPARLRPAAPTAESLRAYADAEWISTRPDRGFQAVTELVARVAGFEARITCRADDYAVILDLVAAGMGVALVPRSAATPRAGMGILPIATPRNLARDVHATTRSTDLSPAVAEFGRLLRQRLARTGAPDGSHGELADTRADPCSR